jgi:hypothetical protein
LDEGSTCLLQELSTTPADKCYSLILDGNVFLSKTNHMFVENVLLSNACMSELNLGESFYLNEEQALAIATALENDACSVLETLTLSVDNRQLKALVRSFPKVKHLRKLNIYCLRAVRNCCSDDVVLPLHALKRNSSLWHVTTDVMMGFSDEEEMRIKFYARRNKQIHAIIEVPKDKEQALLLNWPQILCSCGTVRYKLQS